MTMNNLANDYLQSGMLDSLPDGHFIGGKFTAASNRKIESFDPARAEAFAEFSLGTDADMDRAISCAEKAGKAWALTAPSERCLILNNAARTIRENADWLSILEVVDSGKTLAEASGDIQASARLFEYYAGAADKLDGRSVNLGPGYTSFTVREPIGITGHIIPWNYPTSTFVRGVAPALAAGCSVVAKPAETTPFTALLIAELLTQAGIPDGLVNVVTGLGSDVGAKMVQDPRIRQLTFTGSLATGINVAQIASSNVTRLTLELGGKSPLIAFEDADPEKVADGAYWAIFSNSGQICSAGSRLIVHNAIHDNVLSILTERAKKIRVGHGLTAPDMGAVNSSQHLSRIKAHVDAAKDRGCNILTGGGVTSDPSTGKGWFFEPTVIADLQANDPAVQAEIFGPVLSVQSFGTEEEAIALANGTEFGLIASIYTKDIGRSMRVATAMDCGQVSINDYWAGGIELPFGGNKKSGYGREKGWEGLDAYTKVKAITISNAS